MNGDFNRTDTKDGGIFVDGERKSEASTQIIYRDEKRGNRMTETDKKQSGIVGQPHHLRPCMARDIVMPGLCPVIMVFPTVNGNSDD